MKNLLLKKKKMIQSRPKVYQKCIINSLTLKVYIIIRNNFKKSYCIYLLGTCDPYSQQACIDAGKLLGLTIGGKGYKFAAAYDTKGCYAYHTGIFAGRVYYGTGGKRKEMQSEAYYPKFRPHGFDCSEKGIENNQMSE